MNFSASILLFTFVLAAPHLRSATFPSPEYERRQDMIYAAVDITPLPRKEITLQFDYDKKTGHFLLIHWRTGRERESSQEEMDAFRRTCLEITRKLAEKLPAELSATSELEVTVSQGKWFREFSPDTFVRYGRIPLHFKKDEKA